MARQSWAPVDSLILIVANVPARRALGRPASRTFGPNPASPGVATGLRVGVKHPGPAIPTTSGRPSASEGSGWIIREAIESAYAANTPSATCVAAVRRAWRDRPLRLEGEEKVDGRRGGVADDAIARRSETVSRPDRSSDIRYSTAVASSGRINNRKNESKHRSQANFGLRRSIKVSARFGAAPSLVGPPSRPRGPRRRWPRGGTHAPARWRGLPCGSGRRSPERAGAS